jgi:cell division protease FtsH
MHDFERAKDKIIMGAERRSIVMPRRAQNTAYHESGHAIVAQLLPKTDPVHKVTIIPRGRALGVTMQLPEQDRYSMDRNHMLNVDRGAVRRPHRRRALHEPDDDRRFERLRARHRDRAHMVTRYGMSDELGPMVYGENEGEIFLGRASPRRRTCRKRRCRRSTRRSARSSTAVRRRAHAARGQPRQGRGDGQGAARDGDDRRRPDRRHHGRAPPRPAASVAAHSGPSSGGNAPRPDAAPSANPA